MRKAMVFLAALGLLGAGLAQDGARLYGQYCQGCHQPSGQEVPGAFPPLRAWRPSSRAPRGART
jgi:mono/diheme cytochrome c family protein